jgi:squalene-associated FAD-dependent desaturase
VSTPRVTIIGGGLAGIAAALDCSRAGASVTLLESRGRLGGAAFSFARDGLRADNGQHVFLRCCTAYREFLEEIDATDLVALQPTLAIPVIAPGGRRAWLRRSRLPAPLHLAGALMRYPFLTARQRFGVMRAMAALRRIDFDDPAVDARSFGEWLGEQGQDQRTVQALWDLISRPTLNLEPAAASLAQAAQVFQVGLLRDAAAGDVGYARSPLSDIHDLAARRTLARRGVEVRLRHGATTIVSTGEEFRIEISGAPTLAADVVIVAVPPDRAARLLPPGAGIDQTDLAGLGSSPIVNVHVVYDRRVMDLPFAAGVGTPVQWVFDRTETSGLDRGQYLVVSLSAAEPELEMTVEELRSRYLPALAELFPQASAAKVERFFVTREHSATFRAGPGARALRPSARTALPGLALAGSWTDTGWPATMEGAVRSGRTAAAVALGEWPRVVSAAARVPAAANGGATAVANGTASNRANGTAAATGERELAAEGRS